MQELCQVVFFRKQNVGCMENQVSGVRYQDSADKYQMSGVEIRIGGMFRKPGGLFFDEYFTLPGDPFFCVQKAYAPKGADG